MEDIIDPLRDRVMKDVPMPQSIPLSRDKLWYTQGKNILSQTILNLHHLEQNDNFFQQELPNMEVLRKHFLGEGHINKPELIEILV